MSEERLFLGIDVGTSSVRAGLFNLEGMLQTKSVHAIQLHNPRPDFYEQSSLDIWEAVCHVTRDVIDRAEIMPSQIHGIGIDATYSLLGLDCNLNTLSVSETGRCDWDILVWMDHRATEQARRISASQHDGLRMTGGSANPEMALPKLLWLKENLPDIWKQHACFLTLSDWLTWKVTSSGELPSKIDAMGIHPGDKESLTAFLNTIGLSELVNTDSQSAFETRQEGVVALKSGNLNAYAAEELGLEEGTPVASPLIDANAGGMAGISAGNGHDKIDYSQRVVLVSGTSNCFMAVIDKPLTINGTWGPIQSALVPGMWMNAGGQSAAGSLIDQIIFSHPTADLIKEKSAVRGMSVYQSLNERLACLAGNEVNIPFLTKDIHVLPYFHGNRSPRCDPHLTGMVTGLKLSLTADDLARTYLATLQAIAMGGAHIIETLNQGGYRINSIVVCGGGSRNTLFLQTLANVTGCSVQLMKEPEGVLLGSAINGAIAAGEFGGDLTHAMTAMTRLGEEIKPEGEEVQSYYQSKYQVFKELYKDHEKYRSIMTDNENSRTS